MKKPIQAAAPSARSVSRTLHIRRGLTSLVFIVLIPLFVSFFLYLAATSFGDIPPTVGYGLTSACATNGVSYIWLATGGSQTCGSYSGVNLSGSPSLPTGALNLLNSLLFLFIILGAVAIAYSIVHGITEQHE